jgi:hypothetical protein
MALDTDERLALTQCRICRGSIPVQAKLPRATQDGLSGFWAPLTPTGLPGGARTIEFMVLEHGFGATRINTSTMTHLPTIAAALLANFRTIHFPRPEDLATPSVPSRSDWFATAKACRVERIAVDSYQRQVGQRLHDGHHRFLSHPEPDGEGGWRLHIFVEDDGALSLLDGITDRECGPGDPVSFDPEQFVMERLGYQNQSDADFE